MADQRDPNAMLPAGHRSLTRVITALTSIGFALVAAGCDLPRFGSRQPVTEQGDHTLSLWQGFFVTACVVGLIVFGLILFVTVRFRRRSDEIPSQRGENLKIEAMYVATPIVIVIILFIASMSVERKVTAQSAAPDLIVNVTGYQWGWRFEYPDHHVTISGSGVDRPPHLVLPEGRTTRLVLRTTDVIHSFWVPNFLEKRDLIEGVDNSIDVTPHTLGSFDGRCAEFCGLDHWRMTFVLDIVAAGDFEGALASAARTAASQSGGGS